MWKHDGIVFGCDQCEYKASVKGNLKAHKESIHDGRVKFDCDQCGFKAATQQSLKSHKAYKHDPDQIQSDHEGKRQKSCKNKVSKRDGVKFDCDQCSHQATRPDSLKVHKAAKHGGIKFDCDQCSHQVTRPDSLKAHKGKSLISHLKT